MSKRVAVLTSGGDAPGMNAAIRSVVKLGLSKGWDMYGVAQGYHGLMEGQLTALTMRSVAGIIQQAGTILLSARTKAFLTREGRLQALEIVRQRELDALVVIGGNGSQRGAYELSVLGVPVVGIASTIDNDLYGSEISIGVDTALNVALESIDRLRVTASSHHRAFLVEVMGRKCGYLALMAGIAGGAESIVIPERELGPDVVEQELRDAHERGKPQALVVVAEGAHYNAERLACYFTEHRKRIGFDLRVTRLGHVQRGGTPSVFDRLLATKLGQTAVDSIEQGTTGVLVGWINGRPALTPLIDVVTHVHCLDVKLLDLAHLLAQ